ncbi:MAG: NDP-sugar synthase [Bdellovibrionota bacterium]
MKVMLLAAGEGTRFKPHTLKLPKPSLPLLNVPLAFYALEVLQEFGSIDLIVNTFHLPEKIVETFETTRTYLNSLNFSHEKKLLGSGGGLWQAKKYFSNEEDFILMNADEVILSHHAGQLQKAYEQHRSSKALSTLVVMDHPEVGTKFGGVWLNSKNQVIGFGKTRPIDAKNGYHFIGLQFLSKKIFQYLPDGESNILLNAVMNGINSNEKVQIFKMQAHWFETGNLQDYLLATDQCLRLLGEEKNSILSNITKKFAANSLLEKTAQGTFFIDKTARVQKNQLSGFAVIGANVKIDECVKIKNSVIGPGAVLSGQKEVTSELIL